MNRITSRLPTIRELAPLTTKDAFIRTQFASQSTFYFHLPFSKLAMAGRDTEAGKIRKEQARIMTSRLVLNPS
jgi:hypothetical protein